MTAVATFRRSAICFAVATQLLAASASADPVEDFYKGKTLTIIIGAPPGGAYDLYARTIGKHVTRYIPGNPSVIFQNILGSGSVQAINRIYNEAPHDGTVIGALSNAAPFLPLLGLDQARFDPKKLLWLGSPTAETSVFFVWYTVPVNSFDDLKTREVIVGSNGPNASPGFFAKAMNSVFNTRIKTIYGYTGVPDAMLALQRGEIQGYTGIFWNQLKSGYGNLLKDGKLKILVQFGTTANPELPGVPLASDLIQSKEDKQLFAGVMGPLAIGYPLLMGPGIPSDRAKVMLEAVSATFKDKDFLQETKSLNLAVTPLSGAEVTKIVSDSYAISPELIDRLRALYNAE
jgi:tripartite-type tricarboxylate transporter receptor subunit TctC